VLGDVILEEESSIWYGAVLRGDINRIIIGRARTFRTTLSSTLTPVTQLP